jgi:hypothetical protein
MSCCGQRRAEVVQGLGPEGRAPASSGGDRGGPDVRIEFTRRAGVAVRGPLTGRLYRFGEGAYIQPVDPRDAANLIATGYFRRA